MPTASCWRDVSQSSSRVWMMMVEGSLRGRVLKLDAQPAVAALLAGLGNVLGGDRVGEGEERAAVADGFVQPLEQQADIPGRAWTAGASG